MIKTYGTMLPGLKVIHHITFPDNRGHFQESWKITNDGMRGEFRQLNYAKSKRGVLRGMHRQDQTKLIMPVLGKVFDVALNINTKEWFGIELDNSVALFIPPQYAHGYLVLSDEAVVQYVVDTPYGHAKEEIYRWNEYGIDWPLTVTPTLSKKDEGTDILRSE